MIRLPHNPSAYGDDFEGPPPQGWFYKWVLGVGLPLWLAGYGIDAMLTREAHSGGRYPVDLHDQNAVSLGLAAACLGLFLHCHYFWGNVRNQAWYAELGKIVAGVGFIAGLGFLLVRFGVMGRN